MVNALRNRGFAVAAFAGGRAVLRRGDRHVVVRIHERLGPSALAVLMRAAGISRDEIEVLLGERIHVRCA